MMIFAVLTLIWLVPLGLLVRGFLRRPNAERFLEANDLPVRSTDVEHVSAILRRTYRSRLAGGVVGLLIGGVTGTTVGVAGATAGAGIGLLLGTMLGIAMAQPRQKSSATTTRTASLTVRDAREYLPLRASAVTFGLAGLVIGYTMFAMATADGPLGHTILVFGGGIGTLLAVPIGQAFQRRTVELRRSDVDSESVRVDDALRAIALRAIHHATLGMLMCGLLLVGYGAFTTQDITTVRVGDRVVLRVQSHSMTAVPNPFVTAHPRRYVVEWTEPGGAHRSKVVRTGGKPLTLTSPDLTSDFTSLWGLGFGITMVGFFGVLIEWGRAASAWRRPQRTPTAEGTNA